MPNPKDVREIDATLKFVDPDKLEFDGNNPRFGGTAESKTQEAIQKLIFGAPYYASELVDSLVENGFINYEPLVVRQHGRKFIVIEGNRRLAAVNEIRANLQKYPNRKSDLKKIPVLVFPSGDKLQKSDAIRVYLGVRHLLGIREWPPLAKALFLDRESKTSGGLDKVLKEVRLTKNQARRFLVPYRLLRKVDVPLPLGEDFWVLAEALGRSGVKDFLQLDVDPKTLQISSYHKEHSKRRKIQDTRELSLYANILASEKARNALRGGKDLDEAAIYLGTDEQSLARLMKMLKALKLLISKLTTPAKRDAQVSALRAAFRKLEAVARAFQKKNA